MNNQNDRWRSSWNACKFLNRRMDELYKKYQFSFPNTKNKLQPFAIEMQGIVEDTLSISKVPRVKNQKIVHEEPQQKKTEEEKNE